MKLTTSLESKFIENSFSVANNLNYFSNEFAFEHQGYSAADAGECARSRRARAAKEDQQDDNGWPQQAADRDRL